MKKYIAPELKDVQFSLNNVIAASPTNANIIGGDNADENDTMNQYNGAVTFDWSQTNWD